MTRRKTDLPLWRKFHIIKNTIENPNNVNYPWIGGKGIKMCKAWQDDVFAFNDWIIENIGPEPYPGAHLDRFPNINGDYKPGNLRWCSLIDNSNNRSSNRMVTYKGKTQSIANWARQLGIKHKTIWARLTQYGWPVDQALGYSPRVTRQVKK